ncbi:convertase P-domain protein [Ostertagia ostertagi]
MAIADRLFREVEPLGTAAVADVVEYAFGDDNELEKNGPLVIVCNRIRYLSMGEPFLDSHYFLYHNDESHSRRRKRSAVERLEAHPAVEWLSEQRARRRTKRDYLHNDFQVVEGEGKRLSKRNSSNSRSVSPSRGSPKRRRQAVREIPHLPFPDPLYQDQWYLVGKAVGNYDMNVREAWLLGYAGRNVDHPDLVTNYDPLASTDINDHDDDPTPQNNGDNKHGTRCAGEVAAIAGNNYCGVGVAFKAKIGGVRMLDGAVSDSVEAASLSLNQDHIDIYSASWGPEDDGKTFDGPGPLAREAFYRGIKNGRGGRGNIFVWASGNGGSRQDSCSADGYTTSVYTLSISSATYDNHRPWYLEECPSSIATTYSSANINQPAIVTVDVPSGCTKMHTGTSASAPLAAGIIALALEANPDLTWRDMQHIVLRTANPTPLLGNPGWSQNGVGRMISNKFGYGLMDGGALVKLAKTWKTVPEQHICTYEYKLAAPNPRPIQGRFQMNFTLEVNGCESGTPVLYLEHVQVHATVRYSKRGDLKLTLFSPSRTRSVLLPPRPQDFNSNGFHKWPFLSVQQWGEDPRGTWVLMVESVTNNPTASGTFHDWTLLLYGTADPAQPGDTVHPPTPVPSQSVLTRIHQLTSQKFRKRPMAFSRTRQFSIPGAATAPQRSPFVRPRTQRPFQSNQLSGRWVFSPRSRQWVWITFPVMLMVVQAVVLVVIATSAAIACRRATPSLPSSTPLPPTYPVMIDESCTSSSTAGSNGIDEVEPLTFGDLRSVGDCHPECDGGCTESQSAVACFRCKHFTQTLRNKAGNGLQSAVCEIVLEHTFRSRGEFTLKMMRQIWCKHAVFYVRNDVEMGYYLNSIGKCDQCDGACATCSGPGILGCTTCASGYGNRSTGYCKPCCNEGETSDNYRCEDCSPNAKYPDRSHRSSGFFWSFVWVMIIMFLFSFVGCIAYCLLRDDRSQIDYTPLPHYNSQTGEVHILDSDSDEDDELYEAKHVEV